MSEGGVSCLVFLYTDGPKNERTLTGSVSLTTALPSSLCEVTRTLGPGRSGASWFSVGGRSVEEDIVMSCPGGCLFRLSNELVI